MSVSARRDLARPITSLSPSPSHVEGLGPPGLSWIDGAIEWALAAAQLRSGVGVNGKETQGMAAAAFECSVLIYQKVPPSYYSIHASNTAKREATEGQACKSEGLLWVSIISCMSMAPIRGRFDL